VTAVPDYSHLADDFIKTCDCHMMPLSMASGFIQGVRLLQGYIRQGYTTYCTWLQCNGHL